jgi:hypothetical protein
VQPAPKWRVNKPLCEQAKRRRWPYVCYLLLLVLRVVVLRVHLGPKGGVAEMELPNRQPR